MLLIVLILWSLQTPSQQQSYTVFSQPSALYTDTYALITDPWANPGTRDSTIVYGSSAIFTEIPFVSPSLATLDSLPQNDLLQIQIKVLSVHTTSFTLQLSITDTIQIQSIRKVALTYIAYDYNKYSAVYIHTVTLSINYLNDLNNHDRQEVQEVQYLSPKQSATAADYIMVSTIGGFKIRSASMTQSNFLSIELIEKDVDSYYAEITTNSYTEVHSPLIVNRILVDLNRIPGLNSGVAEHDYYVEGGTSYHYKDPSVSTTPSLLAYYQGSLLYGVALFEGSFFNAVQLRNNIFSEFPWEDRTNLNINYLIIKQRVCSASYPSYDQVTQLCYSECELYFYRVSSRSCARCYWYCYTCQNSGLNGCLSCLDGWHRYLVGGQCLCAQGYYDDVSQQQICKKCSQAIPGCISCTSSVNCIKCSPECALLTPIDCNCSSPSETDCDINRIYDIKKQKCVCKQQTFYNQTSQQCEPCADPCYTCEHNSTFCYECLWQFTLVKHDCSFYKRTTFLIDGSTPVYSQQFSRCLSYDAQHDICLEECADRNQSFFYNNSCFKSCPIGTFSIQSPQNLCHPCPGACVDCFNYSVCSKCQDLYYYIDQHTYQCEPCADGCQKCKNQTYCLNCIQTKRLQPYIANNTAYCVNIFQPYSNNHCELGCSLCFIDQLCQKCQDHYFLTKQFKCVPCNGTEGLDLTVVFAEGKFTSICLQTCGDGIVINQQCDDNNLRSGDGCSSECKVESNYTCVSIVTNESRYSLCFLQNYSLAYTLQRAMQNNSLLIKIFGRGIDLTRLPLSLLCNFDFESVVRMSQSGEQIAFIVQFSKTIQESGHCQLFAENVTNITFTVDTSPVSVYINYNSTGAQLGKRVVAYGEKVSVYMYFALLVTGFTPYNIWAMSYSVNCYVLSLYDFHDEPALVYLSEDWMKYYTFAYESEEGLAHPDPNNLSWASLKILILYLLVVLYYEVIVRALNYLALDRFAMLELVTNKLKSYRLLLYYCLHCSYEPVAIFYSFHIFAPLFSSQQQQPNTLGIVCSSIHLGLTLGIPIALYALLKCNKLAHFTKEFTKEDQKYLFILLICKLTNLLYPLSIYMASESLSMSTTILLCTSATFIFILLASSGCDPSLLVSRYYFATHIHSILIFGALCLISFIRVGVAFSNSIETVQLAGEAILLISLFILVIANWVFCLLFLCFRIKVLVDQAKALAINSSREDRNDQNHNTEYSKDKTRINETLGETSQGSFCPDKDHQLETRVSKNRFQAAVQKMRLQKKSKGAY